jgi:NAD(P)-dependent dehydrogenase (short-subunit alcohol dehydrogenase family)
MMKEKKTVIITGGTKGIGAEITKKFYQNDWYVVIGSRNDSGFADELGNRAIFCSMDVRSEQDHHKIAQIAINWTNQIDVYINCAGFSEWRSIGFIDEEFWNQMIDTNLKGVFWGCKTAADILTEKGCIINVSSLAGKRGSANNSVYCASKFGVNGLTQSLAKELGPRGIRVNAVCPVYIITEGLNEALSNSEAPPQGRKTEEYLKEFANKDTALKRLPAGEEVADLCFYLSSSNSSAVTGQCINVDCGVMPQ